MRYLLQCSGGSILSRMGNRVEQRRSPGIILEGIFFVPMYRMGAQQIRLNTGTICIATDWNSWKRGRYILEIFDDLRYWSLRLSQGPRGKVSFHIWAVLRTCCFFFDPFRWLTMTQGKGKVISGTPSGGISAPGGPFTVWGWDVANKTFAVFLFYDLFIVLLIFQCIYICILWFIYLFICVFYMICFYIVFCFIFDWFWFICWFISHTPAKVNGNLHVSWGPLSGVAY